MNLPNNLQLITKHLKLGKSTLLLSIPFLAILLLVISYQFALAQADLPLSVAPSRQELKIDPGQSGGFVINFYNRGTTPISGPIKAVNFIVENPDGSPTFLEGPGTELSNRFAAASWVTLPYDQITIAPKDKVAISVKLTAPKDAQAGGRYIAVYFEPGGEPGQSAALPKEGETALATRLAGLVYIRVSGPITESASIFKLTAPRFLEYGPITVTAQILNRGNYHIKPRGAIQLIDIFGKVVDQQTLKEENIFPDTVRNYQNQLGQKWLFGKYKILLNAVYGSGKSMTASIYVWVFPWKVVTAIVLALIVLILIVNLLYRRLRRHEEELEEEIDVLRKKIEKE